MRIVHYINQFQAGVGGEDAAGTPPRLHTGPVGPGRLLAKLLAPDHEVAATVSCGDDYAASSTGAIEEILALVREAGADLLLAGPSFTSGRHGLACGRLVAAAASEGLAAIASMHPDNPGIDESGAAVVVESGAIAREMATSMERLAAAARKLAAGAAVTTADGRIGRMPRRNTVARAPGAQRAVDLALIRLAGDRDATEIPAARSEAVKPAAAVTDLNNALVALATEGALVPHGNPDRLESARATRWLQYPIEGLEALAPGAYESVHGGFSTAAADADPHRLLPLDVARDLEAEGRIGRLHRAYLVTAGNGTSVANARRFGVEWAAELRRAGVLAVILTAT